MRVAGIMSGTSLDGIDVAIVDITGKRFRTVAFRTTPYPEAVRRALLCVSNADTHTGVISRLHFLLGELYGRAVCETCRRARVPLASVELIGCHGQTIFHEGAPVEFLGHRVASTLQIGAAAVIREKTGVPVVSDFRSRDVAAGGRGAPLVPFVDYMLYHHRRWGRVALNIGGIANITAIPAGGGAEDVIAFDTGPGNMVIDQLAAIHSGGKQQYDRGGRIAARGRLNEYVLQGLLNDPYYSERPPKSAGREQYGSQFVERLLNSGLALPDLVATATALTAAAVAEGLERFVYRRMKVNHLIVSGGGAHNPQLMAYLAAFLPEISIKTSADYGIDINAKEAIAFALLGYQTWRRRPANLPSATGAKKPVILGTITP